MGKLNDSCLLRASCAVSFKPSEEATLRTYPLKIELRYPHNPFPEKNNPLCHTECSGAVAGTYIHTTKKVLIGGEASGMSCAQRQTTRQAAAASCGWPLARAVLYAHSSANVSLSA